MDQQGCQGSSALLSPLIVLAVDVAPVCCAGLKVGAAVTAAREFLRGNYTGCDGHDGSHSSHWDRAWTHAGKLAGDGTKATGSKRVRVEAWWKTKGPSQSANSTY